MALSAGVRSVARWSEGSIENASPELVCDFGGRTVIWGGSRCGRRLARCQRTLDCLDGAQPRENGGRHRLVRAHRLGGGRIPRRERLACGRRGQQHARELLRRERRHDPEPRTSASRESPLRASHGRRPRPGGDRPGRRGGAARARLPLRGATVARSRRDTAVRGLRDQRQRDAEPARSSTAALPGGPLRLHVDQQGLRRRAE